MPPQPKLYRVEVSYPIFVLAPDEDDARRVAARNAEHELGVRAPLSSIGAVAEVADRKEIPADWAAARPYATPGTPHAGLTCPDALAAIRAAARKADLPGQARLFEEP